MPPTPSDDGYDSDSTHSGSEFQPSDVQLGLADGPLEADDESNPLVSRIGGRAAWLPIKNTPLQQIAQCASCTHQMQLLVQIFAPLVESPYDRCLMVWGCARPACQRNDVNSLKVIRTLKFNHRWAAKLEKQKAKRLSRQQARKEREAADAKAKAEQLERSKINPFSTASSGSNAGLGGMLFGGDSTNPFACSTPAAPATAPVAEATPNAEHDVELEIFDDDSEGDYESESESERLAEELALKSDLAATNSIPSWVESCTRYPPLYLNTIPEPCSSSISKKLSSEEAAMLKDASASGALNDASIEQDLKGFAKEGYERMLLDGIDDTFERFLKRVSVEPRQAVRYEFGGEPIAFHAKGKIYDLLWPKENKIKAGGQVSVTKGQFKSGEAAPGERSFSSSAVPPCPECGAQRIFEAQLMPNLINLLKADQIRSADGSVDMDADSTVTTTAGDEQAKRKAAIEQALGRRLPGDKSKAEDGGSTFDARTGLVWSTAFIFTCSKDCCVSIEQDRECWKQEIILAQFEDEQ
ncbi:related to TSR4 - cytoplasmic protein required for correct processing of the 20S pre-rRNA [Melanopsichium pennsylvanicum]|uniref:Related to TSR4 - cytoplasmic protein required for correct processing of the 20S pre-rRNA n=2 Tax=Melanopsichium pennsylvanicum TaxID=63383 RepID=A0AAJ5C4M7_9BASI|nr:uncharacterized conserved protein [Melanopsichium pennsylvanicum 4]SNX83835.1 related to TSR4 - cytoplasmic protein required for correct processing of the 20S pre-rRNA [Melanopsichium pennsylvanicum]